MAKKAKTEKKTKNTKRTKGYQQARRGYAIEASWASTASVDTAETAQNGLLDMIATEACVWLTLPASLILPECDGKRGWEDDVSFYSYDSEEYDGDDSVYTTGIVTMSSPPSCQDVGDFISFGRRPVNLLSIRNRCASVDGSELSMPYIGDVKSAVSLEPLSRPITGRPSVKARGGNNARKGTCRGAGTNADTGLVIQQLYEI
jgi:hypothetical protein